MTGKKPVFSYEIISSLSALAEKQNEWNVLLEAIPDYLPTMTYPWHSVWLKANENLISDLHFMFYYDRDKTLIGIIPLFKMRTKFLAGHLDIYTFSGGRDQIKTGIICKYEHRLSILKHVIDYFYRAQSNWDLLALRRISARKADDVDLERVLVGRNYPFSKESALSIPFVIINNDWETYWKSRKKHFRHEVKRKTKKLSQLGNIEFRMQESPMPQENLQQFLQLENSGWKGKNNSSILHRPHLLRMYTHLSQLQSEQLKLINFNMLVDNRLISSSLCLRTPHGLYVFKIAYDESFNKYSPGILLRLHELQYSFENHLHIYDFSGKEQKWMHAFTNRKNYVMDYIIYNKTLASLIRYLGFTKFKPVAKHFHLTETFFKNLIEE